MTWKASSSSDSGWLCALPSSWNERVQQSLDPSSEQRSPGWVPWLQHPGSSPSNQQVQEYDCLFSSPHHIIRKNGIAFSQNTKGMISLFNISFPGGSDGKDSTRNEGALGRDPLEKGVTTHSSILAWRIPMDRGAWWATVCEVAKSWARLSN